MSSIKKGKGRRSDDTMDDDSDEKDTKRKSRNLSEKKRRDQFNLLVNELSSMVSSGGRKMDKSTVLKSTISFLKNHNEVAVRSRVHEIQEDWKPSFLTNEEFTHLILEAVDGFIMVFSTSGQIFYASESITSLLGHLPSEVLNTTIYEMACEEEQNNLYNTLLSPAEDEGQVSFSCYLKRGSSSPKQRNYFELVHFVGYFRSDADMVQGDNRYSGYSGEADTRLVFVGTGRLQTPQLIREMSLTDSSKSEFTSRHSLEWKFLFLDHRAPPIIGYLPFELLGTSGYDYYHVDDLDKVVGCHESLMQKGEGTSCYYRFLTKGQQWIWLQTRFYITYHQWHSKPEFIVCTHRVVSYVDVLKQNRIERDETDGLDVPSPTFGNNTPVSWPARSSKGRYNQEASSDCTSMSADSPGSKLSVVTQHSVRSRASQSKSTNIPTQSNQQQPPPPQHQQKHQQQQQQPQQPQQQQPQQQPQPQPQQPQPQQQEQFVEPPHYVAAIPVQPVIASFPPPAVLTPLQPVEMTRDQTMLHADLQRKHAELQASIGQQQAELMAVSEQLLMARLGLLSAQGPQPPRVTTPYSYNSSGTVSSTTAAIAGSSVQPIQSAVPSVQNEILIAGVGVTSSLNVLQPQPNVMYTPPDSNTPSNLAELK